MCKNLSGGRIGRADGARRKQNGTKCPIGQKIFGAGAISGGIYSRLLSGADRAGLLAEREPDDGKGRLGGRRPCMGPGPTGRMCAAAAILYENSVQPELWRDAISNWYPQTAAAEVLREGGASCEL